MKDYQIVRKLEKPLTENELKECATGDGRVKAIIPVFLSDMIGLKISDVLSMLSKKVVGNGSLIDIQYNVVGLTKNGMLELEVSGDASFLLNEKEENDLDYD